MIVIRKSLHTNKIKGILVILCTPIGKSSAALCAERAEIVQMKYAAKMQSQVCTRPRTALWRQKYAPKPLIQTKKCEKLGNSILQLVNNISIF